MKNILILLLMLFFPLNLKCDDAQDLEKIFSPITLEKNKAFEMHLKGDFQDAIYKYETTLNKLTQIENIYKDILNDKKNMILELNKIRENISNNIESDGFYIYQNTAESLPFTNKIEDIFAIAWLVGDNVKVAICCNSGVSHNIKINLGYEWEDSGGERGFDPISSLDIVVKPFILTEISFKGIPSDIEELDKYKTYTEPSIFINMSEQDKSKLKYKNIPIQGILNNDIDISFNNNQYYFSAQSKINFKIKYISKPKENEEYRIYLKRLAYFAFDSSVIKITDSNEKDKSKILELKNGFALKDFPYEFSLNLSNIDIADIKLLYLDDIIYEVYNKETKSLNSSYIPGQPIFIFGKKNQIEYLENIIPEERTKILLKENSSENKIKNLITKLKFKFWNISYNAKLELIKTGKESVPYLLNEVEKNSEISKMSLEIVGEIGTQGISHLIEFTNKITKDVDLQLFEELAKCYKVIGSSAIDPLFEVTKEKNISKTIFVCMALEQIKDKKSGTYLIEILEDLMSDKYTLNPNDKNYSLLIGRENYLKALVIHGLGILEEKKSVPLLIKILQTTPNEKILEEISFALSKIQDESTVDTLIFLADCGFPSAVSGLRAMKIKESIPQLIKKFPAVSRDCQLEIAKMCMEIGDIAYLTDLVKLMDNEGLDSNVKNNLQMAIEQILNRLK